MGLPEILETAVVDEDGFETPELASYFIGKLKDSIESLTPSLRMKSEVDLIQELEPTPLDYALRRSFWKAVETAKALSKNRIAVARIYEGCCSRGYFEESFVVNPLKVAWMIRPIIAHEAYYEAINKVALDKILNYVKTNDVTEKTLALIVKVAEMSANRAYGAVAQKMQIQSKNLNVEMRGNVPTVDSAPDHAQLAQKIEAMQQQLISAPKDVTPKE